MHTSQKKSLDNYNKSIHRLSAQGNQKHPDLLSQKLLAILSSISSHIHPTYVIQFDYYFDEFILSSLCDISILLKVSQSCSPIDPLPFPLTTLFPYPFVTNPITVLLKPISHHSLMKRPTMIQII